MSGSKACFKCNEVKPLSEFYKHSQMADGHLNKCKECTKSDVAKHRDENIEKIREYDRVRGRLPHRVKLAIEQTKKWRSEDSRRMRCHNAVAYALRKGTLAPGKCSVCGAENAVSHHEDYDKPLDVVWLCQIHHKARHAENHRKKKNAKA